jgi:8-hydroxy-5-deazaflavin:NADPH oxidoreductase
MKISIIGAGNVGGTLGSGWAERGHEISFGVPDPAKTASKKADGGVKGKILQVADAAKAGEVVVLAVPWKSVPDALRAAGNLKGKIVLDATNPLQPDLTGLDTKPGSSGGEQVAALVPGVPVIKIFNTTGFPNMANPDYNGERATMFYCGDDQSAKEVAARLASELGFEPVDAGPLSAARLLEPLALLWIRLANPQGQGLGYNIAFKLMRR